MIKYLTPVLCQYFVKQRQGRYRQHSSDYVQINYKLLRHFFDIWLHFKLFLSNFLHLRSTGCPFFVAHKAAFFSRYCNTLLLKLTLLGTARSFTETHIITIGLSSFLRPVSVFMNEDTFFFLILIIYCFPSIYLSNTRAGFHRQKLKLADFLSAAFSPRKVP